MAHLSRRQTFAALAAFALPASAQVRPGRHIEIGDVNLYVVDTGGAGDAIILLHPTTGNSDVWQHQIAAFSAAGYRVIAPDKPGWARSTVKPGAKPIPYAETLDALADKLGLQEFHLVGVANGGYTSLDYAAWKQSRLKSLTFGATGLGVQVDAEGSAFRRNSEIPGFDKLPPEVREMAPTYRGMNPEGVKRWLAIEHNAQQKGAVDPPLRTPNTVEKLATLDLPILVVAGDVDLQTPSGAIRLWAKHLKRHEFMLVPEAGHVLMWEQPQTFNKAVLEFIGRHR